MPQNLTMAGLNLLTKSLGWRLSLLFFWTVVVCCVLYASRSKSRTLSAHSATSLLPSGHSPAERSKRLASVNNTSVMPVYDCKAPGPSQNDMETVRRFVHHQQGNAFNITSSVHCSVIKTCSKERPFKARCFSRDHCSVYKVRMKHREYSDSVETLPSFVESWLRKNSFTTLEDLTRNVDIRCEGRQHTHVKLFGDVLSTPRNCQTKFVQSKSNKNSISILYFRFLSQWELPVRFPGLMSLLSQLTKEREASVEHFTKFQATEWTDYRTLSSLLQGDSGPFIYNDSLLDILDMNGYCLNVEDLSCSRSRQQDILMKRISSYDHVMCGYPSTQRTEFRKNLCAGDNATDSETRVMLTSFLSHVHHVEGHTTDHRPSMSISVLNAKDFRNSEVLDSVLMNLFTSFLEDDGRSVILMSDVGNPGYLRFDLSVPLHTQASNPAFMLLSAAPLSSDTARYVSYLQAAPISMTQVHYFVRLLVQNDKAYKSLDLDLMINRDTNNHKDPDFSCGGLNVKPPFTCLCEDHLVSYNNDTLMVAFAELAVTMINEQLQHVHLDYFTQRRSHCAKLAGVSFSNMWMGFHGDRRRIVMDITLENELYKDRVLRRVLLDLWGSDKVPQAAVQVFKADLSSSSSSLPDPKESDSHFLKTLCQSGETLDRPASFSSSAESALLKRWSQARHFGQRAGQVTSMHDNCLYLLVRDFGDSVSVEAANVCQDRSYDVLLHLSLLNMMSLTPTLPLSSSAELGPRQRQMVAVLVKVSYTVPTFAFKLYPDFHVSYHD